MHIEGITFAGTATLHRPEMVSFLEDVMGLRRRPTADVEADVFSLPDGSIFAVASPAGMGPTERSIGFRVADLEEAINALGTAGIQTDEIAVNSFSRYVHFVAPDGNLYELIQSLGEGDG